MLKRDRKQCKSLHVTTARFFWKQIQVDSRQMACITPYQVQRTPKHLTLQTHSHTHTDGGKPDRSKAAMWCLLTHQQKAPRKTGEVSCSGTQQQRRGDDWTNNPPIAGQIPTTVATIRPICQDLVVWEELN